MVQEVEGSMVMSPPYAVITWHPYPKEKPTENGQYIITGFDEVKFVCSSMYHTEFGWSFLKDDMVIAWAEMPKAYEQSEGNV